MGEDEEERERAEDQEEEVDCEGRHRKSAVELQHPRRDEPAAVDPTRAARVENKPIESMRQTQRQGVGQTPRPTRAGG